MAVNPRDRYFTTAGSVRKQLPGADVRFLKGRGYYAFTPGAAAPLPGAVRAAAGRAAPSLELAPSEIGQIGSGISAQIKAAQAAAAAAAKPQTEALNQQAERAQGFALALANLHKGDPAAIADQYRQSAELLHGLGTGLTGAVGELQRSEADKAAAEVARVTGGLGQAQVLDPGALRNAAQYMGVNMPAQSLADQAASASAAARAANVASETNVGGIAQDYLRRVADLHRELSAKQAEIAGQRPTLMQTAREKAAEAKRQNYATLVQGRYLQNTLRQTGAGITGIDPVTGKETLASRQARVQQLTSQFNNDRNYQLALDRLGVSQDSLKLRAATTAAKLKATAKNGGYTPSQRIQLRKRAGKMAQDAFYGVKTSQKNPTTGKTETGRTHYSYQETIRRALSEGIPLQLVQQALNQYWKPGQDQPWEVQEQPGSGRPLLSLQERQAMERAYAANAGGARGFRGLVK